MRAAPFAVEGDVIGRYVDAVGEEVGAGLEGGVLGDGHVVGGDC